MTEGRKDDNGKPRMELLPALAIEEVAKVLTHGADKYGDTNWRNVRGGYNRYVGAALRHIFQDLGGAVLDPDSGREHLAHAVCSLLFVLERRLEKLGENAEEIADYEKAVSLGIEEKKKQLAADMKRTARIYADRDIRDKTLIDRITELVRDDKKGNFIGVLMTPAGEVELNKRSYDEEFDPSHDYADAQRVCESGDKESGTDAR